MLRLFKRDRGEELEKTQEGVRRSRDSWFGRIVGLLRSSQLDEVWEQMEGILISADVGVDTSLALVEKLKSEAEEKRLVQPEEVLDALKRHLVALVDSNGSSETDIESPSGSPLVILVVGVNGVGKTTSIAKLAYRFKQDGKKVLIGAADTFRAAAIDQLKVLSERVGVEVVAHQQGADPGAVAYDAYQAGKARGADVLVIDTAGRLHTKSPLMEELKKVRRVINRLDASAPHQVILTLDATTGYNGLSQARSFTEAVDCTGIFLAKLDGTAKGGIALAINHELGLPVLFIGTGEQIEDMTTFDPQEFVDALLSPVPSSRKASRKE